MAGTFGSFQDMAEDIIKNPRPGATASIDGGSIRISIGFSKDELRQMHGECGKCYEPLCWCRCA